MTPQAEQQLIQVLQQISAHLSGINGKLGNLQSLPSYLSQIASKTGR